MSESVKLKELLSRHTMVSAPELVRELGDDAIQCLACGHRCRVLKGREGVCRVRFNRDGQLLAPAGYVAGVQVDPIEKKPFYHVFPARDVISFGMLGCDLHCGYCQNWITSQAIRDDKAVAAPTFVTPDRLLALASVENLPAIVSTYNEPLITADWAVEIFRLARDKGLRCGFISNGNATPEVLEYIRPWVDLYKVDLKSFEDRNYRSLGGQLGTVLETIERLVDMKFWVEVVTLVIPTFNDGDDELRRMAEFLAGISVDIPWHVTGYYPDYKMSDPPPTPVETLCRAHSIGRDAGLRYVYAGNRPGRLQGLEDTHCPGCDSAVIRRHGFRVLENVLESGRCPSCQTSIPGVWEENPPRSSIGNGLPRRIAF